MLTRLMLACGLSCLYVLPTQAASPAPAADTNAVRVMQVSKEAKLELSVPKAWADQQAMPPKVKLPTITFTPPSGKAFSFLVSVNKPMTDEKARATLMKLIADAKPQAVETDIPLKDISGSSGAGFYFFATDKAPKPGEFKYMVQGILRTGNASLIFTLLSNEGADQDLAQMLAALKTAKFSDETSAKTVPATEKAPEQPASPSAEKDAAAPKKSWSKPGVDLTGCLNKGTNTEVMKCANRP